MPRQCRSTIHDDPLDNTRRFQFKEAADLQDIAD